MCNQTNESLENQLAEILELARDLNRDALAAAMWFVRRPNRETWDALHKPAVKTYNAAGELLHLMKLIAPDLPADQPTDYVDGTGPNLKDESTGQPGESVPEHDPVTPAPPTAPLILSGPGVLVPRHRSAIQVIEDRDPGDEDQHPRH